MEDKNSSYKSSFKIVFILLKALYARMDSPFTPSNETGLSITLKIVLVVSIALVGATF